MLKVGGYGILRIVSAIGAERRIRGAVSFIVAEEVDQLVDPHETQPALEPRLGSLSPHLKLGAMALLMSLKDQLAVQ